MSSSGSGIVVAPSGHRIRLDFRGEFHIETSEKCDYDYLQVVDGPFSYSPVVGRYCGRHHPPLIESTGRYLWLRFQSDDSIEYVGFHIVYEFIPTTADHHDNLPGIPSLRYSSSSSSLLAQNSAIV